MRSRDYLEKYGKLTKALRILSRIGFWVSLVLTAVLLPAATVLLMSGRLGISVALPENLMLVDGVIRYNIAMLADSLSPADATAIIARVLFSIAVYAAVVGATLFFLCKILHSVEQGNPFDGKTPGRLSAIGVIFLAGSVLVGIAQANIASVLIHAMNLTESISAYYTINDMMVISGLLLLILSAIFRYGSYLQEEYDATL